MNAAPNATGRTLIEDHRIGRLGAARPMFFDEPGAEKIENLFHQAAEADKPMFITAVNWAEVLYKMQRKHGTKGLGAAREFERAQCHWMSRHWIARTTAQTAAQLKTAHDLGAGRCLRRRRWPKAKKPNSSPPTPDFKTARKRKSKSTG